MKKNVWIFHHYATPPKMSGLTRPYDFGKKLIEKGYNVKVFASAFLHYSKENLIDDDRLYLEDETSDVPFVYVKTAPYSSNGIDRVKNMLTFYSNLKKVVKIYAEKYGKPDMIYASSPHPLTLIAGIQMAKKFGIECIGEVRDLWPLSIVEYTDRFTDKNLLIKLLYQGEKWIYKKVDKLIFTMEGGYDYIKDKGWEKAVPESKVFHINNGVDLKTFNYNKEHYIIDDSDLKNEKMFKVVYAGSVRKANNLGILLNAAKKVRNSDVKFLIWGDGNEVPMLKQRLIDENITNVEFKGKVHKKYIPYIVSSSNLNILNYQMHDIWKYGGSQNKLFEYFAGKTPIITNLEMGYDLIKKYNAGFCVQNASDEAMAEAIDSISNMDESEYNKLCENCNKASTDYDFDTLTDKLINVIECKL